MMNSKHTPGPWKVRTAYDNGEPAGLFVHAGVLDVCSLCAGDGPEEEADARLIATAPELLEAAKDVVDWFRTGGGWRKNTPARVFFLLTEIAKAEGR